MSSVPAARLAALPTRPGPVLVLGWPRNLAQLVRSHEAERAEALRRCGLFEGFTEEEFAERLKVARVARYKSNDRVDKREEPKGLSHGHVLVRHATMQIWAA